ncbi:MAG: iron-sulfur cluster insertion protein ErpA [Pseudomonadota bacterium]
MSDATSQFDPASQAVALSESAVQRVARLLASEPGGEALKLRVFVTGGGCSGFSYGFTFDEEAADDDAIVEQDGVTLLVDSLSYPYLAGSVVDYVEDLSGAQFIVTNPNAAATCGCGNSFAV